MNRVTGAGFAVSSSQPPKHSLGRHTTPAIERYLKRPRPGGIASCLVTANEVNKLLTAREACTLNSNHLSEEEARYFASEVIDGLEKTLTQSGGKWVYNLVLCEGNVDKQASISLHAFLIEKDGVHYRVHQSYYNQYEYSEWFAGKIDCVLNPYQDTLFFDEGHLKSQVLPELQSLMSCYDQRDNLEQINSLSRNLFGADLIASPSHRMDFEDEKLSCMKAMIRISGNPVLLKTSALEAPE